MGSKRHTTVWGLLTDVSGFISAVYVTHPASLDQRSKHQNEPSNQMDGENGDKKGQAQGPVRVEAQQDVTVDLGPKTLQNRTVTPPTMRFGGRNTSNSS